MSLVFMWHRDTNMLLDTIVYFLSMLCPCDTDSCLFIFCYILNPFWHINQVCMAVWFDVERAFPISLESRDTKKVFCFNQCYSNSPLNEVIRCPVVFTILFNANLKTLWDACLLVYDMHLNVAYISSITKVCKLQVLSYSCLTPYFYLSLWLTV